MNMSAKQLLIHLVSYQMSEANCERIIRRIGELYDLNALMPAGGGTPTLPVGARGEWDESEHPRADDGKFTHGNGGTTNNRVDKASVPTAPDRVFREHNEEVLRKGDLDEGVRVFKKKPTKHNRDKDDETIREHRRRAKEGRSVEDCRRAQNEAHEAYRKAKKKGSADVDKLRDDWMESKRETKRAEKNEREFKDASRRVKHYNQLAADVEDEIDEIEEKYGVAPNRPLEFTEDEDGDYDRQRYKELLKERKRLDKITSAVFDEDGESDGGEE